MKLWIVSAPNEPSSAFEKMSEKLDHEMGLCKAYQFKLPKFRVGTLDSLMAISDTLAKDDQIVESIVDRLLRQYRELANKPNITPLVEFMELDKYLQSFEWDEAKFSSADSLEDIEQAVMGLVARTEDDLKLRLAEYTTTKQAVTAIERRSSGNLMTKSLVGIVTEQDYLETEHMQTVFVVMPTYNAQDFLSSYEELSSFVVPRSAKKIISDNDYSLYSALVFKKALEEFKVGCREKRFTVRDYKYNPSDALASEEEYARLRTELDDLHVSFVKWCETNFGEAVIAQLHLKAIRSFVESVLRYGLLVNFEVALLKPAPRAEGRLRNALQDLFGHFRGNWASQEEKDAEQTAIPGIAQEEFYPYVFSVLTVAS